MFGREEFRPIIDGITIGLQVLLMFIGTLTLGIGGVGVMNIMLVSVDERIREIGLRRALGARRGHIRLQFLAEALVLTLVGGVIGILLAPLRGGADRLAAVPRPAVQGRNRQGRHPDGDLARDRLGIRWNPGRRRIVSGFVPSLRASRLDPVAALRYE